MTALFDSPAQHPESVLLSIYNAYPRRTGRPQALKRINEALNRICMGEIDGEPRTAAEAIEFLRVKVEEARRQMGAREQKFIPHMATWLHQRRYLRPELAVVAEQPKRLETCIAILGWYPTMPSSKVISSDPMPFMPALAAIDKALARKEAEQPNLDPLYIARRLRSRTELYAMAVKQWPLEDLKFVPNPQKWYGECRYEQPEASWSRQPVSNFNSEREQLKRVLQ